MKKSKYFQNTWLSYLCVILVIISCNQRVHGGKHYVVFSFKYQQVAFGRQTIGNS